MIEQIAGYVAVVLALVVVVILVGAVVAGSGRKVPEPPRDLCAHGCGIVHSVMCQNGTIIEGFPLYCERAYGHGGRHEAEFADGSRCWPNRAEDWRGHEVLRNGPPFKKMIL